MMTTTKQIFKSILFRTEMVQAILEDRKTKTRRTHGLKKINEIPGSYKLIDYGPAGVKEMRAYFSNTFGDRISVKPKYQPGDVMWVRETWFYTRYDWKYLLKMGINHIIKYKADNNYDPKKDCVGRSWKPSIHMPKLACRIFLEVTNVRVERLQDISEEDIIAEGIKLLGLNGRDNKIYKNYMDKGTMESGFEKPLDSFISLWHSINGIESWIANPWVWVYDFKRVEKPENFLES